MTQPLDSEMFAHCAPIRPPIRIGGKWTAKIVVCLTDAPRRFSELEAVLPGITPKVLTESLRAMERDGLVTRTAFDEHPPRVEYALTPLGRTLLRPIAVACRWTRMFIRERRP
ncbi:winged helix-turn-helix transcriptional regulator [Streptosporangium sp. NBC_01756]|uniref:winged helix-turn-helix transcriptional regulator n=1 Tax=Streptosporangium sp. NBC_01756 TaxID=2975950 RepID=UPI002DDB7876|nr:helix-turn-helix domain-containing protein [Streptosporangium sp. NBC_01756]WSC89525.1 helix-turn-helix transcriptional regulator [Streptosporangium sp. NBC_01756]